MSFVARLFLLDLRHCPPSQIPSSLLLKTFNTMYTEQAQCDLDDSASQALFGNPCNDDYQETRFTIDMRLKSHISKRIGTRFGTL